MEAGDDSGMKRLVDVFTSSILLGAIALGIMLVLVLSLSSRFESPKEKVFGCGNISMEKGGDLSKTLSLGNAAHGKELFDDNCASCHNIHKVMVGPALKGILERRKMNWIIRWVRNPAQMVASKDPYAMKLAKEYESAGIMTGFGALKKKDIEDIMAYVGSY